MSTIDTAVTHAHAGLTVLWLTARQSDARTDLDSVIDRGTAEAEAVRRSAGVESIRYESGGSVRFMSAHTRHGLRGLRADIVYLPHWRLIQDEAFMEQLLPVFASTGDPRIGVNA